MPGKGCKKGGRAHTPITSQKQRGLMGSDLARARAGKKTKTGMSQGQLESHLRESGGKKLPKKAGRK